MGQAVIMTQRKCDFILTLMLGLQTAIEPDIGHCGRIIRRVAHCDVTVIHTVLCGLLLQYLHVYRVPTNPITKQHPSRVKFGLRHPLRVMSHSDTTPVWHPSLHACSDAALVRSRRGGCDGATACPSLLQRLGQCVHSSLCFRNRESSEKMQRRSISALLEHRNAQRSGAPGA